MLLLSLPKVVVSGNASSDVGGVAAVVGVVLNCCCCCVGVGIVPLVLL